MLVILLLARRLAILVLLQLVVVQHFVNVLLSVVPNVLKLVLVVLKLVPNVLLLVLAARRLAAKPFVAAILAAIDFKIKSCFNLKPTSENGVGFFILNFSSLI
jgi:hypothetical protein